MIKYDLLFENDSIFNDYYLDTEINPISFLPNFSTINIIIGANNSGKSRFMRKLMSANKLRRINLGVLDDYNSVVKDVNEYLKRRNYQNVELHELKKNSNIENVINENMALMKMYMGNNVYKLPSISLNELSEKKYYIPTLRTAHSIFNYQNNRFEKIEGDIFYDTLNNHYKLDKLNVEVFTGLHLYKEILNTRNSKREIRELFDNFESFVSKNFFENKRVDIVAEFNKDESLKGNNNLENISVHIDGDKKTRNLFELGDGIQAIIILMYKIFMAEPEAMIFIDEPELNLHPGMQRLFLEQISSNEDLKAKNLTYIISTHSNHFLDLTIEKDFVSMYSFSPKIDDIDDKQFIIKNVNRGDNKLLQELGVNNSSVFMANCSIWVEGISDRNYIKAFLKSYCEYENKIYPKEDIDFAFFEYAGSNIDHYVFDKEVEKEDEKIVLNDIASLALSNRIFLLADSDASKLSGKKGRRLKALEDAKMENFIPKILWNLREVENLITNDIWKEILINLCNKTLIKSHKDEIIKKIDDALSQINSFDFQKKYIGEFLEELRNRIGKISATYILNQSTYEVKSESFGTIINKRELSELVFNKNFSWEVLSKNKEIENLTIEIYDFIMNK